MKNFFKKAFSNNKKKATKKGVSFKSKPTFYEASLHLQEEPAELEKLWYRPQDMKDIQRANNDVVKMMASDTMGHSIEANGECPRGLESQVKENKRRTYQRRQESYAIVLSKQSLQMMQGIYDPEAISKYYSRACEAAVQDALEAARLDEEYLREAELEDLSEHLLAAIKITEDKSATPRKSVASLTVVTAAHSYHQEQNIRTRI